MKSINPLHGAELFASCASSSAGSKVVAGSPDNFHSTLMELRILIECLSACQNILPGAYMRRHVSHLPHGKSSQSIAYTHPPPQGWHHGSGCNMHCSKQDGHVRACEASIQYKQIRWRTPSVPMAFAVTPQRPRDLSKDSKKISHC